MTQLVVSRVVRLGREHDQVGGVVVVLVLVFVVDDLSREQRSPKHCFSNRTVDMPAVHLQVPIGLSLRLQLLSPNLTSFPTLLTLVGRIGVETP